ALQPGLGCGPRQHLLDVPGVIAADHEVVRDRLADGHHAHLLLEAPVRSRGGAHAAVVHGREAAIDDLPGVGEVDALSGGVAGTLPGGEDDIAHTERCVGLLGLGQVAAGPGHIHADGSAAAPLGGRGDGLRSALVALSGLGIVGGCLVLGGLLFVVLRGLLVVLGGLLVVLLVGPDLGGQLGGAGGSLGGGGLAAGQLLLDALDALGESGERGEVVVGETGAVAVHRLEGVDGLRVQLDDLGVGEGGQILGDLEGVVLVLLALVRVLVGAVRENGAATDSHGCAPLVVVLAGYAVSTTCGPSTSQACADMVAAGGLYLSSLVTLLLSHFSLSSVPIP